MWKCVFHQIAKPHPNILCIRAQSISHKKFFFLYHMCNMKYKNWSNIVPNIKVITRDKSESEKYITTHIAWLRSSRWCTSRCNCHGWCYREIRIGSCVSQWRTMRWSGCQGSSSWECCCSRWRQNRCGSSWSWLSSAKKKLNTHTPHKLISGFSISSMSC